MDLPEKRIRNKANNKTSVERLCIYQKSDVATLLSRMKDLERAEKLKKEVQL